MKNVFLMITLCFLVGCVTLSRRSDTDKTKTEADEKAAEIQQQKDLLNSNNSKKLNQIGVIAKGTHHALDKITGSTNEVDVAKQLNDRVASLAGNPEIKDVKRIQQIVDDLISEVKKERDKGTSELSKLDREIQYIQSERDKIKMELEKKTKSFEEFAYKIAGENDENKAIANDMNKWFGLGAIVYGVKKFVSTLILTLVIGTVVFLLLKMLSRTNPIAGAIFGLFEMAGSFVLFLVKSVTPKSFEFSKFVNKEHHDKYKSALDKIVDTIESMKEQNKVLDDDKKYKLDDVLVQLEKVMDNSDKSAVAECLKELKWKI